MCFFSMKRDSATKRLKGEYALNKPLFPDKHLALIKEYVLLFFTTQNLLVMLYDIIEYFPLLCSL